MAPTENELRPSDDEGEEEEKRGWREEGRKEKKKRKAIDEREEERRRKKKKKAAKRKREEEGEAEMERDNELAELVFNDLGSTMTAEEVLNHDGDNSGPRGDLHEATCCSATG